MKTLITIILTAAITAMATSYVKDHNRDSFLDSYAQCKQLLKASEEYKDQLVDQFAERMFYLSGSLMKCEHDNKVGIYKNVKYIDPNKVRYIRGKPRKEK